MKEKPKNKKIIYAILGVIAIALVVVGLTYAYWLVTKEQKGENVITTACLDIDITSEVNDIMLTEQYPISDDEGKTLIPYEFTVTNKCDTSVYYQIALETMSNDNGKTVISPSALKVMLDENSSKTLNEYTNAETTIANALSANILGVGTLSATGDANASATHKLRIWIDANAPIAEMNRAFTGKISVTVGQGINKTRVDYEAALASGEFTGVYDQYVIENVYNAKLGAKVNYEEPETLGYDGEWVILGEDNGQIVLVSTKTVSELELAGKDGYLNGIKKLNDASSPYANGTTGVSARSIKMSDLNELIEYDPTNQLDGKPYGYGTLQEYGVTVTYKKIGDQTFEMTRVKPNGTSETTTVTFPKDSGKTGEYLDINSDTYLALNESKTMDFSNSYYQYALSTGTKIDFLEGNRYVYTLDDSAEGNPNRAGYKSIFLTEAGSKYWLADKSDLAHDGGAGWGITFANIMTNWINVSKETLYHSTKYGAAANGLGAGEFSAKYKVRPVVYLNWNVELVDSNSDGIYEIVQK